MKTKFNLVGALFFSLLFHFLFFLILFYFPSLGHKAIPDEKYENFKVTLKLPEENISTGFEKMKKLNEFENRKNNAKKISARTQKIVKIPEKTEIETTNDSKQNTLSENQIEVVNSKQPQVLPIAPINFSGNAAGYGTGSAGAGSSALGESNVVSAGSGYGGIGSGFGDSGFEGIKRQYKELVTRLINEKKSYPKIAKKMRAEGEVIVIFSVTSSGKVENIQLKSPCKWEVLNNEAIECIRKASPFPNPPFVIKEALFLSIKIIFKLE